MTWNNLIGQCEAPLNWHRNNWIHLEKQTCQDDMRRMWFPKQWGEKEAEEQNQRKLDPVVPLKITRGSHKTSQGDQFALQILRHSRVSWSTLSVPARVLSPVYLANSIETIGCSSAVNISVFSALTYFHHPFWTSAWVDDPSKHFCSYVSIHLKPFAVCVLRASLLLFDRFCCCCFALLSCSATVSIHCRHKFNILIMDKGCKLLWQVYM